MANNIIGFMPIYNAFLSTFFKAFNTNTEIIMIRYDLRFPKDISLTEAKKIFYKYKSHLWIKIQRAMMSYNEKHQTDLLIVDEHFWVMEVKEGKPHFHCITFVNSQLGNYLNVLKNYIEPCWNFHNKVQDNKGLVQYCQFDKLNNSANGWVLFRPKLLAIINKQKSGLPLTREEVHCLFLLTELFKKAWYLCKVASKPINQPKITNNERLYSGAKYRYTEQDLSEVPMVDIFDSLIETK